MKPEEHRAILRQTVADYVKRREFEAGCLVSRRAHPAFPIGSLEYVYSSSVLTVQQGDSRQRPDSIGIEDHYYELLSPPASSGRAGIGLVYRVGLIYRQPSAGHPAATGYSLVAIAVFEEHVSQFEGGRRLSEHPEALTEVELWPPWHSIHPDPDYLGTGETKAVHSFSEPWARRKYYYRALRSPFHLLEAIAPAALVYESNKHNEPVPRSEYGIPDGLEPLRQDFEYCPILLHSLSQAGRAADFSPLSLFGDHTLVTCLTDHELPILRSIVRGCRRRQPRQAELKFINEILDILKPVSRLDAVGEFCYRMFYDFGVHLVNQGKLAICDFCGRFFLPRHNKRFCSLRSEGRDCGKKARNARQYEKHRERIKDYYREEMRETRSFQKAVLKKPKDIPHPTEST